MFLCLCMEIFKRSCGMFAVNEFIVDNILTFLQQSCHIIFSVETKTSNKDAFRTGNRHGVPHHGVPPLRQGRQTQPRWTEEVDGERAVQLPEGERGSERGQNSTRSSMTITLNCFSDVFQSQKDPAAVDKIMKDLDANGDNQVDFEEFVSLVVGLSIACEQCYAAQMKQRSFRK